MQNTLLNSLISIPSVSREETAAADMLQRYLASMGLEVHRTADNLWVESEPQGTKPTLLLDAHIDTVKPVSGWKRNPFIPSYEGGRLYGLGANDDGGSVVALLEAFCRLSAREQPYRLVLSLSAEEEVSGKNGLERVLSEIGPVSLAVVGEPTGMRMAVAEKGLMVLDCTAEGVSAHAAGSGGVNAIYKAVEAIERLRRLSFEKESEFLGPVKITVAQIQAGSQHNVVPDLCSFVVDVRSNGLYSNEEVLSLIKESVADLCLVNERSTRLQSSRADMTLPIVVRGKSMGVEMYGSPTLSNQALLSCPSVKIGPGDSARSHTADEYIELKEIENAVRIYFELLDGLKID